MAQHYVDNQLFLKELIVHRKSIRKAKREKVEAPPVSEYLGTCILQIANHLAFKPNFINYSFRDEMISDGIENCLTYINNFDPKKSKNPFAYFTQICYYAFVRRIQKEKKVLATKQRYIGSLDIHDVVVARGDETGYENAIMATIKHLNPHQTLHVPEIPEQYRRKPKYMSEDPEDDHGLEEEE